MKELLRTNDLVLISWIQSNLEDFRIKIDIFDGQMSVLEGSANAIPRRLMVDDEDHAEAVRLLKVSQSEIDGLSLFDD